MSVLVLTTVAYAGNIASGTLEYNDPAYMQGRRPNGFFSYKYHAVALMGYNFTSSTTQVRIMDPAYEGLKFCTLGSDGKWTFPFGADSYTWYKTIRLLYSV